MPATVTRNRRLLAPVLRGVARGIVQRRQEFRHHVVRDVWTVMKRFSAGAVHNVELREIPGLGEAVATGYVDDRQRVLISGLAQIARCATFFEIGTNRGRTTWTVAVNNPDLTLYTLELAPDTGPAETAFPLPADDVIFVRDGSCGEAFRDSTEADRITQLWGDSARFDFAPYRAGIDLVYIDGAHVYEYVALDTGNALDMLTPTGTIVWDDYAINPDVFRCVNEFAATADADVVHVLGTRMAIYSRSDLVRRVAPDHFASVPTI